MPFITSPSILQVRNALNAIVVPVTRSIQFSGAAVVTQVGPGLAQVNVSGSTGAWDVTGNAGAGTGDSGFVLGTTTPDSWHFITDNTYRGGFLSTGENYLKTHVGFPGSEFISLTNGVLTIDNTPTTLFALTVPMQHTGLLTVNIQARRNTGTDRASFERKAMFHREMLGAVLSSKIHTTFTDKTQSQYDVLLFASGNDIIIQVIGKLAESLTWTGVLQYQMSNNP